MMVSYRKWGRGGKRIVLRFSKSGDPRLEAAYSRCYGAKSKPPSKDRSKGPAGAGRRCKGEAVMPASDLQFNSHFRILLRLCIDIGLGVVYISCVLCPLRFWYGNAGVHWGGLFAGRIRK
jgi:hypothetical protein